MRHSLYAISLTAVIPAAALSASLLSTAHAQQAWPAGEYCGFRDLQHLGMVVYPPRGDGKIHVSLSVLLNKEDLGGSTIRTHTPTYIPFANGRQLEGVVANDGTVSLFNGVRYAFTEMKYANGRIFGNWHLGKENTQVFPVNLGDCARVKLEKPAEYQVLFGKPASTQ